MVASRARPRRGLLMKEDGRPHNTESLARVTRLPAALMTEAVSRLLEIGLLEVVDTDVHEISNLPPHPAAGMPQGGAGKPQEGAVEGKGIEHHHQEGNGKEKEEKRRERAGADLTPEHSDAISAGVSSNRPDDGENPEESYASPEDELKAIYLSKTGDSITIDLLDVIRANLEVSGVSFGDYVARVRKDAPNKWRNPPGFLRDLSMRFRSKTRVAAAPVTAAEAAARNYQCSICFSRIPGEGLLPGDGGKFVPCECASPEYIERQRQLGNLAEELAA